MTTKAKKIKKLMIDRDISGAEIARRLKVDRSMVSLTIAGRRKSLKVRRSIADALGVSVADLWPEEAKEPCEER